MADKKQGVIIYLNKKDYEIMKVLAFFQSRSVNEIVRDLVHNYVLDKASTKLDDMISKYNEIKANSEKEETNYENKGC